MDMKVSNAFKIVLGKIVSKIKIFQQYFTVYMELININKSLYKYIILVFGS